LSSIKVINIEKHLGMYDNRHSRKQNYYLKTLQAYYRLQDIVVRIYPLTRGDNKRKWGFRGKYGEIWEGGDKGRYAKKLFVIRGA
jgi:hypothetical protein